MLIEFSGKFYYNLSRKKQNYVTKRIHSKLLNKHCFLVVNTREIRKLIRKESYGK